jgi:hypothetical protein
VIPEDRDIPGLLRVKVLALGACAVCASFAAGCVVLLLSLLWPDDTRRDGVVLFAFFFAMIGYVLWRVYREGRD